MHTQKIRWGLVVLLLAALACSALGGGGNQAAGNNNDDAAVNSNNTAVGDNNTAADNDSSTAAANNSAANDDMTAEDDGETGGIVSSLNPDSACYNPFMPVNQEVTWTYEANYPAQEPFQYTIAITDVTDNTITSTTTFPEFSSEVVWNCKPEGLFSSEFAQFDFSRMPGLGDVIEVEDIETVSYEGATLPAGELWEVGYSWDSSFEIVMHLSMQGTALNATASGSFTNEITAIESVTVPAGTFPHAYRVETTGTISLEMMDTGVVTPVPVSETIWYVKDIGMVKDISLDAMGESVTVLVSFE